MFRPDDFVGCVRLVPAASHISAPVMARLPIVWRRLHRAGQLHGGVVVDPHLPEPESIVGFGLSVFLEETFLIDYLAAPTPYLSTLVYERLLTGQPTVLPAKSIPAMNASGTLNLGILHFGLRHPPTDDRGRAIVAIAQTGFRLSHGGYRLNRVVQEAYGSEQMPYFIAGGFVLKSDYSSYYAQSGRQVASAERPYLMGLYKDDSESRYPGTAVSDLFGSAEP